MASQIIVYGPSLKSQILRLIVVHLWFRRWKQILRQWRGCCVVFNGSVRTRWKRSIRQCGSLKQNYVTRLIVTLPPLHLQLTLPFSSGCKLRSMIIFSQTHFCFWLFSYIVKHRRQRWQQCCHFPMLYMTTTLLCRWEGELSDRTDSFTGCSGVRWPPVIVLIVVVN